MLLVEGGRYFSSSAENLSMREGFQDNDEVLYLKVESLMLWSGSKSVR